MVSFSTMEPFDSGASAKESPGSGTPEADLSQGYRGASPVVRGRDLIIARWIVMGCQATAVFVLGRLLKLPLPYAALVLVIGAGVLMNIVATIWSGRRRPAATLEQTAALVFDTLQLAALFYLTGGSTNPFCVAFIFPARMAASMLPLRSALIVAAMIVAVCVFLAFYSAPTPWAPGLAIRLPEGYRVACASADVLGVVFAFAYGWWMARQAAKMEFALHMTDTFLARQQRLSALGGLAAAAAHELGTPLTTIAVIAKDMARDAPQGPLRDDAWLLVEQAGRCRDILRRLARAPETSDAVYDRVGLTALVEEISAPFLEKLHPTVKTHVAGAPNHIPPDLWRRPEILPAMTAIVENAVDFARAEVQVIARYDTRTIALEVRDDGPGFEPDVLTRLGEPYITSRADVDPSRLGHVGMGLGLFIAKTLLERTGARVTFSNGRTRGAVVTARWPRSYLEAPADATV
jgi:two-component system sensor histidine kinase RegB